MKIDDDEFYTNSETAAFLSLREETLVQWRYRGKGPSYHKIGRAAFYRGKDIKAFVEAQRCQPSRRDRGMHLPGGSMSPRQAVV